MLFSIAACSRPQKVLQPQARVAADATLRLAQNLEQKQRWQDSVPSYQSSMRQYQAFGEIRGQIYALAGLARIAYQHDQDEDFRQYRSELQELVDHADPPSKYIADLVDIFVLESEGRYSEVLLKAVDAYEYPIMIRMQMLSHRLQAESYLRPKYGSASYEDLGRLSSRYRKTLKRDFSADPTVLSGAEYAMSYYCLLQRRHQDAMLHIERAIDLDYRYENFCGLGSAYWLRGRIHEALAEPQAAMADYVKASGIFTHTQNLPMQEKVNAARSRLQGD